MIIFLLTNLFQLVYNSTCNLSLWTASSVGATRQKVAGGKFLAKAKSN